MQILKILIILLANNNSVNIEGLTIISIQIITEEPKALSCLPQQITC